MVVKTACQLSQPIKQSPSVLRLSSYKLSTKNCLPTSFAGIIMLTGNKFCQFSNLYQVAILEPFVCCYETLVVSAVHVYSHLSCWVRHMPISVQCVYVTPCVCLLQPSCQLSLRSGHSSLCVVSWHCVGWEHCAIIDSIMSPSGLPHIGLHSTTTMNLITHSLV